METFLQFHILLVSLTPQEVDDMTGRLPKLKHNSDNFFRNLGSQGLISYR